MFQMVKNDVHKVWYSNTSVSYKYCNGTENTIFEFKNS